MQNDSRCRAIQRAATNPRAPHGDQRAQSKMLLRARNPVYKFVPLAPKTQVNLTVTQLLAALQTF
jgi:hypothetical protein